MQEYGGLSVDVGWPDQLRRYLFADAGAALPAGYGMTLAVVHGAYVVCVADGAGATAATGRITLDARTAVFDRIETMECHRRKGLASVAMLALDRLAIQAGVTERLLVATEEGARLYQHLGWRHLAPFSTAVLVQVPGAADGT